jgi:hypothetical protein
MATLYTFAPNTKAESVKINTNFTNINNVLRPSFGFGISGTITTGTNQTLAWVVPQSMTIVKAYAYVKTAPTGASIIIDINKNSTSIWNTNQANRLTIAAAANSGTQTSFDTTALSEGDVLTLDIDQIGSTVAGDALTIVLKCQV